MAFALAPDATGGYTAALLASAVPPLLVGVAALLLPVPRPLDGTATDSGSENDDAPSGAVVAVVASSEANVTNGSRIHPDVKGEFRADCP